MSEGWGGQKWRGLASGQRDFRVDSDEAPDTVQDVASTEKLTLNFLSSSYPDSTV